MQSLENPNIEIVRAWAEAFNAQDLDAFLALHTRDCEYHCASLGLRDQGHEGHRATLQAFLKAAPDRTLTIRRSIAQGDAVAVEYLYEGTSAGILAGFPPQGEKISMELCAVLTFRAGKIARHVDYQ